jgi:transposase
MRPKGSPEALEMRRKDAVKLLNNGFGVRKVARILDVSPGAVSAWKQAYEIEGEAGLAAKPQTGGGRPPLLSYDQYPRLEELLLEGPHTYGFETDLWTLARVGRVIEREFDVSYSDSGVRKVLKRMGWSYQKPQSYTQKRDEKAVARWRATTWPELKKAPAETDA